MKTFSQKILILLILVAVGSIIPLRFFSQGDDLAVKTNYTIAQVNTNPAQTGLKEAAEGTGLISKTTNPVVIAGTIVRTLLSFLGIIFIILLLYGGWLRMISKGDATKVKTSTDIITSAIIGVAIIFLSYILTLYIFGLVGKATQGTDLTSEEVNNPTPTTNFLPN